MQSAPEVIKTPEPNPIREAISAITVMVFGKVRRIDDLFNVTAMSYDAVHLRYKNGVVNSQLLYILVLQIRGKISQYRYPLEVSAYKIELDGKISHDIEVKYEEKRK